MSASLGIGTVQFGLDYGIANAAGRSSPDQVAAVLAAARRHGISVLDTAAAYGESEAVLGAQSLTGFSIVTKTPPLKSLAGADKVDALSRTFAQSLHKLNLPRISGLLCHDAGDLLDQTGPDLWRQMKILKDCGQVSMIGASVYDGEQIVSLLSRFDIDLVQLPVNVLDQRLLRGGFLARLKDAGVTIHARSVFLQGLLLMQPDQVPAYFEPIRPQLRRWHATAAAQGLTPIQAALAFLRDVPEIDTVLVGIVDQDQLDQCAADFATATPFAADDLACDDPAYVNPARWNLTCH